MARKNADTDRQVYQIKVTLTYSEPPIWRRIQVRSDTTLGELHDILQAVMGWENCHFHDFTVGQTIYGVPHPALALIEVHDEERVRLNQIVTGEKFKFIYQYDFGDSWEHVLLVEKILAPEEGVRYPRCIEGGRACPPEDVGGMWGYYDFLKAIKDPQHPDHEDMLEWIGGAFDPDAFDLAATDARLRAWT